MIIMEGPSTGFETPVGCFRAIELAIKEENMQFRENAKVVTKDGDKVGRIDRVVIDPETKTVTHLVVKKGFLFTKDKVVSVKDIDTTVGEQVILKNVDKPDDLPDFEETRHVPLDNVEPYRKQQGKGYARPIMWYHAHPGIGWWGEGLYPRYSRPEYAIKTELNIPENTVALEEGAKVVSVDGEQVGDVERVFTEPEEHRATHILISKGIALKEKRLIPTRWVESVSEGEIRLSVESDIIQSLSAQDIDPHMH
jgi:uncharacterized protein YrrD